MAPGVRGLQHLADIYLRFTHNLITYYINSVTQDELAYILQGPHQFDIERKVAIKTILERRVWPLF
jgi:hypothetical protein